MAFRFETASSQYLLTPTAVVSSPPFSVSCWFKLDSTGDNLSLLTVNNFNSQFEYFRCAFVPGTGMVAQAASGSSGIAVATASPTVGAWQHLGGVWSSSSSRACYLNGGNKGTNSSSVAPSGLNRTAIGAIVRASNPAYSTGEVAEVAVWSAALSDEEIALLAKGFSPLCLWWRWPSLVLYQDLIRPLNRLAIGPTFTATGSPTIVPHPRSIHPATVATGIHELSPMFIPYRLSAALAHADRVRQGWAALAGAAAGDTYPIGEVSS